MQKIQEACNELKQWYTKQSSNVKIYMVGVMFIWFGMILLNLIACSFIMVGIAIILSSLFFPSEGFFKD